MPAAPGEACGQLVGRSVGQKPKSSVGMLPR